MQVKVDVYIQNPHRCYSCQVFGHHENKCGRHPVCCNCGEPEHCGSSGVCDIPAKCVNCSGDHPANLKQCPQWEKEKKILKIKCENNLSFPDARKQYEQFYAGQTYAVLLNQALATNLHKLTTRAHRWTTALPMLKQTTEKTQGTQDKRNSSPHPGKSNSSHPGHTLKGATLEMMKKDEEKKKKEEKDKLKKHQKEERKQQWQKKQAQKK